jgi:hypothetical protein
VVYISKGVLVFFYPPGNPPDTRWLKLCARFGMPTCERRFLSGTVHGSQPSSCVDIRYTLYQLALLRGSLLYLLGLHLPQPRETFVSTIRMVFSTEEQSPDAYHLWKPFSFPTDHGLRDSVAVSVAWGQEITAVYSILLQLVFVYTLYLLTAGVFIAVKRKSRAESSTETEKATREITEIIVKGDLPDPQWF